MKLKTAVLALLIGILVACGITVCADSDGTYVYSVSVNTDLITAVILREL